MIADNPRNFTTEVVPEHVPDQLKGRDQWVNWAAIWNEAKAEFSKPPMTSNGCNAS